VVVLGETIGLSCLDQMRRDLWSWS